MADLETEDEQDLGFGESSRYAAHLDRGWAMLEHGDIALARTSAEQAQELRPEDPDAAMLLGAIASVEGNADEALRAYDRAIELDCDYLDPYISAVHVCLYELDDPGRALSYCEDSIELEDLSPLELLEFKLLAIECELAREELDAARRRLDQLDEIAILHNAFDLIRAGDASAAIEDPEPMRAAAAMFLSLDHEGEPLDDDDRGEQVQRMLHFAVRYARVLVEVGRADAAIELLRSLTTTMRDDADLWHALAEVEHFHGDARSAVTAAFNALQLDAKVPTAAWMPSEADIASAVVAGLADNPAMGEMDEAVDRIKVIVADFPPAELILDGAEPRLPLAAFGPPLDPQSLTSSRSQLSGIVVYRRNLARFTRNRDEFFAELKASLEQELNAFFAPAVQRTREPAEKKVARAKTKTAKNPKKKAAKKRTTEKPRTDNK